MIPNDSNINSISAYFKYEDNTKENSKTINTKGVYNKYELMSNGKNYRMWCRLWDRRYNSF